LNVQVQLVEPFAGADGRGLRKLICQPAGRLLNVFQKPRSERPVVAVAAFPLDGSEYLISIHDDGQVGVFCDTCSTTWLTWPFQNIGAEHMTLPTISSGRVGAP
jgi:hypothetical protein